MYNSSIYRSLSSCVNIRWYEYGVKRLGSGTKQLKCVPQHCQLCSAETRWFCSFSSSVYNEHRYVWLPGYLRSTVNPQKHNIHRSLISNNLGRVTLLYESNSLPNGTGPGYRNGE